MLRSHRYVLMVVLGILPSGSRVAAQPAEQPPDRATAEVLFARGVALLEAGEAEAACPLLEQSEAADHGIGTLLYLADCYQRTGRSASAWAEFRRAASLASAAGQLERARSASERATELEAGLSTLTVTVAAPTPGLIVQRDGLDVPPSVWSLPVPVDPGEHEVVASAAGHTAWRARIQVHAEGATVEQAIPRLVPIAPLLTAPLPAPVTGTPLRRNPWLWATVGVVTAGAALALGLLWRPEHGHASSGYGGSTGDRVTGP